MALWAPILTLVTKASVVDPGLVPVFGEDLILDVGNQFAPEVDRPAFRRHLRAIISGNRGGRYEWQAVHG